MAAEGDRQCELPGTTRRELPVPTHHFVLAAVDDPGRAEIETYIAQRFSDIHGATINSYLPQLLSLYANGVLSAALGLRRADSGTLFLEQYLDRPVEQQLAEAAGRPVARADIVEIGNLVSTSRGSSRLLFLMLAELFASAGMTWAIFTATPEVHKLLARLTADQIVLCTADGKRLGAELKNWGSYYDTCPEVTAINVTLARDVLLQQPLVGELLQQCAAQAEHLSRLFMAGAVVLEGSRCS
ncbi:thermostable hemolysin [Microbulbifer variabilis]|uniref:thermostable hemolysin n=1 Tax=Microbulbifer variabilis TaxID=266805 RepID=UPI001CFCC178|nr:thermostable hemolysin [Microbulbifer variabilis]